MPHCLRKAVVLRLPPSPEPSLQAETKPWLPHWTEQTASCKPAEEGLLQASRGRPWQLKPWGQGTATEGKEKASRRIALHPPSPTE